MKTLDREEVLKVLASSERLLAPSILSADFSKLGEQVRPVQEAGARFLHVDVMDGHFVPNITIGPVVVSSLSRSSSILLDVHLMIDNPEKFFDDFIDAGSDMISFHYEACSDIEGSIKKLREREVVCGIAINPDTPIEAIEKYFNDIDFVLLMSVFPGFAGQSFIESVLDKISELKRVIDEKGLGTLIEVDGGVKMDNLSAVAEKGANLIVAGSAVFGAEDVEAEVRKFVEILKAVSGEPRRS